MKVQVNTDQELIAAIKARSVRAPERDVPDSEITCWREHGVEHFFLGGFYWHSMPHIPLKDEHS